jgi:hypothetical protein
MVPLQMVFFKDIFKLKFNLIWFGLVFFYVFQHSFGNS